MLFLADRRALHAEQHADDDATDSSSRVAAANRWIAVTSATRRHKQALKGAGLRQTIRLHDLRHSAAAGWLAAGCR